MPTITAPLITTHRVVTGTIYEVTINEASGGPGITRLDFGPYIFPGIPPQLEYPEAVTSELAAPGWQPIGWVIDERGQAWLRFEGGRIVPEDGTMVFQFTSNFPPSDEGPAKMVVWRGNAHEEFQAPLPDYSSTPPARNSRRDSTGQGRVYRQFGCLPQTVLIVLTIIAAIGALIR